MKYLNSISLIMLMFLGFACSQSEEKRQLSTLITAWGNDAKLQDKKLYVVLPVDMCHSCVDKTVDFVKTNKDNTHLCLILTNVYNEREVSVKYGYDFTAQKNVFIAPIKQVEGMELSTNSISAYMVNKDKSISFGRIDAANIHSVMPKLQNFLDSL